MSDLDDTSDIGMLPDDPRGSLDEDDVGREGQVPDVEDPWLPMGTLVMNNSPVTKQSHY